MPEPSIAAHQEPDYWAEVTAIANALLGLDPICPLQASDPDSDLPREPFQPQELMAVHLCLGEAIEAVNNGARWDRVAFLSLRRTDLEAEAAAGCATSARALSYLDA
jgi:hypothetical protein